MKIKKKQRHQQVSNDVEIAGFRTGLKINKLGLDDEVAEQPDSFDKVSERLAMAKSIRDGLKDDLKTVEAELRLQFKSEDDHGTDKDVDAKVQISTNRRSAFRRHLEACREVDEWEGLKEAYKDRSYMLKSLVELHVSAYGQSDSITSAQSMERDYRANRNKDRMHEMRRQHK